MSQITDLWAKWRRNEDYLNSLSFDPPRETALAMELEQRIVEEPAHCYEDVIVKLKLLRSMADFDGHSKTEKLIDSALTALKTKIPTIPACKHEIVGTQNHSRKELFHV